MEQTADLPTPSPYERMLQRIRALPARAKIILMVIMAASIAVIVGMLLWIQQPDFKVLFSGLSDRDAGAVMAALNQMQVTSKISDGGASIMVPADKVHEIRLRLAQQGLPKASSVGFESMDNTRYGMTQFQEQVHFQRALEGELARSVMSLSAVQSARVHIAVPKPSVFVRDSLKPTASVVVTLHPGHVLDRSQLQGIVHLVASSVPDLQPRAVSVVDQHGNLLTGDTLNDASGLDANQLSFRTRLEAMYIKRIIDILSPIVGEENVRAQVNLDVDFAQVEQTSETYRPNQGKEQGAIRSQQSSDQQQQGPPAPQGVPGALTNQPPGGGVAPIDPTAPNQPATNPSANAAAQAQGPTSSKRDLTTNYEVDKTVSHSRLPTGTIRRLSAAIVVNHKPAAEPKDGKPAPKNAPTSEALSPEEITRLSTLAKEAIGFSDKRGDSINLISAAFTKTPGSDETPIWRDPGKMALTFQAGKWLVVLLISALLVFGVMRPVLRQLTPPEPEITEEVVADADEDAEEETPELTPLERAREIARNEPRLAANVISSWLTRERS